MNFVAIDFETATNHYSSACAVGIVTVENGIITDEYYTLIQPPDNEYTWQTIRVHGIRPADTANQPHFGKIFPEVIKRLEGKTIVAHNEAFDRNVLMKTMANYSLCYTDYDLKKKWECTCQIYRNKGFKPANLSACCMRMGIELQHHQALSDALGCAKLYLMR